MFLTRWSHINIFLYLLCPAHHNNTDTQIAPVTAAMQKQGEWRGAEGERGDGGWPCGWRPRSDPVGARSDATSAAGRSRLSPHSLTPSPTPHLASCPLGVCSVLRSVTEWPVLCVCVCCFWIRLPPNCLCVWAEGSVVCVCIRACVCVCLCVGNVPVLGGGGGLPRTCYSRYYTVCVLVYVLGCGSIARAWPRVFLLPQLMVLMHQAQPSLSLISMSCGRTASGLRRQYGQVCCWPYVQTVR